MKKEATIASTITAMTGVIFLGLAGLTLMAGKGHFSALVAMLGAALFALSFLLTKEGSGPAKAEPPKKSSNSGPARRYLANPNP